MIQTISKRIVNGAAHVSAALIILLPLAVIADVFSRNVFARPLPAVFEGTEYAMLWIPLLASPAITLYNEHIVVDLIDSAFRSKHGVVIRAVVEISSGVISTLFVGLLAVMAWDSVAAALNAGTLMATTMAPPRWMVHVIIPIASTLMVLVFGSLLAGTIAKLIRKSESRRDVARSQSEEQGK